MADYDIRASVDPPVRQVILGEDADFSCLVSGSDVGTVDIKYTWVAHHSIIGEQRFRTINDGAGFQILRTTSAENNTDVSCTVRLSATKQMLSSAKSKIVVMPVDIVQPPITPYDLTGTKNTANTKTSTISSVPTTRQTLTDNAGKTSHNGHDGLNEGVDAIILGGAIAGVVALLLVFCCLIFILFRSKKSNDYVSKASFSGRRSYNLDGVPRMKRYEFMDTNTGNKIVFSEMDGFVSPEPPPRVSSKRNQEMRSYSRGSAPDLLAGCDVDGNTSPLPKQATKPTSKSNDSLAQHLYESVTPSYIEPPSYNAPSAPPSSQKQKHPVMQFDNHSYTDIIVGDSSSNSLSSEGTTKLEETNNLKNSTNGPPLDRFGYVELNIEPPNLSLSSDEIDCDNTQQTVLPSVHHETELEIPSAPELNNSVIYRP